MISSITFTDEYGFLPQKVERPIKPSSSRYRKKEYEEVLAEYKKELEFYEKHKGEYIVPCAKNLVGRKFEFVPDKINLIFGPNASGKTTILKCIAHQQLISDGFMSLHRPTDFRGVKLDETVAIKHVRDAVENCAPTACKVEQDGAPIYWHNFSSRQSLAIGDLTGSVFSSVGEEFQYIASKDRSSSAQIQIMFLMKLMGIMKGRRTVDSLLGEQIKEGQGYNSMWRECYNAQYEYYRSFPNANGDNIVNAFLFDEIDASMDILNVVELYTKVLPCALDMYGQQIIIISHSPIVLSKAVYESKKYNIISMNEEYTHNCIEKLKNCW